jgi:hypothetical protein
VSPETSAREVFERLRVPGALLFLVADALLLLGALASVVIAPDYSGHLATRLFSVAGSFLSLSTLALPVVALLLVAVVRPVRTEVLPVVAAAAVAELGAAVVLGTISILAGLAADVAWQTRLVRLVEALGWLAVFLVALLGSVQTLRLKRNLYAGHSTTVGGANGGLAPAARWGTNPQPEVHQQAPHQQAPHQQAPQQPAATGRAAAPQVAPPPPGGQYAGQFEPPPGQGHVGQSHAGQPSGSHQVPGAPGAWSAQAPWPGQASWPAQPPQPPQPPQPGYPSQAPPQPPYPGPPAQPSAPPPPPSAHEPPPPPAAPPPPPAAPPPAQPPSPQAHQAAPPQVHQTPPPAPQAPGPVADTGRPPAQSTTFVRASDLLPNLDELSPGPDQPIRSEQRPAVVSAQPGPSVPGPSVPGPSVEPPTVVPTETGPGIADAEPDLDEDDTITRAFRVSSPEEPPAR